jgi:regulator of sigma E protease
VFDFLPAPFDRLVPFAVVLGVLVFFHELGHYLAARWRGVHVEAFSIGFGRAIATWTDRHGTVWKLGWIPLGGYVKLHGQQRGEDVPPEQRTARLAGHTFAEKSVASRAIIIAAGPLANFALAAVLLAGLFASVGEPQSAADLPPTVGSVAADSAAQKAGLLPGDRIIAIDNHAISQFSDLQRVVSASPGKKLSLNVRRGDAQMDIAATPGAREQGGKLAGVLGIAASPPPDVHVSLLAAARDGVVKTVTIAAQTLVGVWQMIDGHRSTNELGGVLRIAQISGEAARMGVTSFVTLMAVLSINIGLINLFPIPILDGGHLAFLGVEAIRGRPLPPRAVEYGFRAGLALIVGLFVFATWNDITSFGWIHWITRAAG